MAPQIRLIQSNDITMSEKIQSTLVNTIPLWKSQMVIAIGLDHASDAAKTLMTTLDDVMKIQEEGREKRRLAEADLQRIENEMRQKLLEISNNSRENIEEDREY